MTFTLEHSDMIDTVTAAAMRSANEVAGAVSAELRDEAVAALKNLDDALRNTRVALPHTDPAIAMATDAATEALYRVIDAA